MAERPVALGARSRELTRKGKVVGFTDRVYSIHDGSSITFEEVEVKGDLSGELEYNGRRVRILHVETAVGLLVDSRGARGPVWKGVQCEVVA